MGKELDKVSSGVCWFDYFFFFLFIFRDGFFVRGSDRMDLFDPIGLYLGRILVVGVRHGFLSGNRSYLPLRGLRRGRFLCFCILRTYRTLRFVRSFGNSVLRTMTFCINHSYGPD